MKFLKRFTIILLNILMIPLSIFVSFGATWYILDIQNQEKNLIKDLVLKLNLTNTAIFWILISSAICFLIFFIILLIISRRDKARWKNLMLHLNSWLICLTSVAMSLITFIQHNPLKNAETIITDAKKIVIGFCIILLVIFHMGSRKISAIVNRRIQAYESAKEANVVGRGSVIFTNILKLFEIFFPEIIILSLLCMCISWNLASYFIVILGACLVPVIANIICDFNIRAEIKRKQEEQNKALVQNVVNAIKGDK